MKIEISKIVGVIVLLLFVMRLVAQRDIIFEQVSMIHDTDIGIVSSITQDKHGYIWAATEEGILKYNGLQAQLYNEYDGLPKIFSNKVQKIYIDNKNTIWATSDNHLARYNPNEDRFDVFPLPNHTSIIYAIIRQKDKLFLGTYNGLWTIDIDSSESVNHKLKDNIIHSIVKYGNSLYVGSSAGLFLLDANENTLLLEPNIIVTSLLVHESSLLIGSRGGRLIHYDIKTRNTHQVLQAEGIVYDALYDEIGGKYFVGVDGDGLYVMDEQYQIIDHYLSDVNKESSLSSNGVYDLHKDTDNQIWIATYGGGINKFKSEGNLFQNISHIANEEQSIANSFTRAIVETKEGNIWYGTKEGISIYNPRSQSWQHQKSFDIDKKSVDIIMCLEEDGDFMWVGTYGNGAFKVNKTNLSSVHYSSTSISNGRFSLDKVYCIHKGHDGSIWLGGINAPLHRITGGKVSTIDVGQIRHIQENILGDIYTVGRSGLNMVSGDSVIVQSEISSLKDEFDYSTINCLIFSDKMVAWVGTNGDGLIRFDLDSKEYRTLNVSDGLPSDIIQGLILRGNDLWASTSRGLVKININSDLTKFEIYNKGDGIKNVSFNYGSFAKFSDDRLAFGTTEGVVILDPQELHRSKGAPPVILEQLTLHNSSNSDKNRIIILSPGDSQTIKLGYDENFFKINFSGIDQLYPKKILFTWKMDGLNSTWSRPSKDNEVTMTGLSPGDYVFNVKAIDRDGNSGLLKSLAIKIKSPWWASYFAYIIYGILLLSLLVAGFVFTQALLKKKNAEEQISFYNNITHELKTPLSILLTKLESASDQGGKIGEVKSTVKRMNSLFDQLLNFKKVNTDFYKNQKISKITFTKHVNLIVNTFQHEMKLKNIAFTFNNDWPYEHFYYKRDVLDKITFNLISNAVKYSTKGGAIILEAKEEDGKLKMIVKDNGIGIPKDEQNDILKRYYRARNAINSQLPGTGLGLMIVKNLLEYDGGSISFTSEEGLGSAFTVSLSNLRSKYEGPEKSLVIVVAEDRDDTTIRSHKFKILVVEDNDELRIDLVEKLSELYSIVAARNGKEGLEKAMTKLPDLIITDLIMPEMDGNQLCIELQKNEDTNHIPVFMMTVLNNSTQKLKSIESGITSYMTKPIDYPFLVAKINSTLEYKKKLREKYLHDSEIEKSHNFKNDRDAEFIQKMETFILEKIKEESISVQDLCKHMGMSRTSLYMKIKEMIDMSLQNFIITTKMNHARTLLLKGGVTVKEVAFQVGFANPKYFSTSFKKQFGNSPSGFLKSLNPS